MSIFLGLALPQLAATMRPMLALTSFIFIMLSFARTDADNLKASLSRPGRFAIAWLWALSAVPALTFAVIGLFRQNLDPDIVLALALYAAAPPLMGSPAYTALLGFRNGLIIAILFVAMAITPLAAPAIASYLADRAIPIDPVSLGQRLLLLVGGAILCGVILRKTAGAQTLAAKKHLIDGIGVVCFFLFAIAAMDGVIDAAKADLVHVLLLLAGAFGVVIAGFALTLLCMAWLGPNDAFSLAMGTGLRNMGLLIAALGLATPKTTYLYFAMMQFPVYMAPLLASPVAKIYARKLAAAALRTAPLNASAQGSGIQDETKPG